MTGFGKAVREYADKKFTVEIRTLNGKQLDLGLRIPAAYRTAEIEIRNAAARIISRGKADITVSVESRNPQGSVAVNRDIFKSYYEQILSALQYCGESSRPDPAAIAASVMRLPEVTVPLCGEVSQQETDALLQTVAEAMDRLNEFREQEGKILIEDLLRRVDKIEELKEQVIPFEKARTETIRTRIRENIEKIGLEPDTNRLEQEMIFYIEKLDITEEKVRLSNHCRYFRSTAAEEPEAGRKLGFIAQEMGREINTLGSKANDSDIQRLVVRMKDELEKIKEQVLNIL